MRLNLTFHSINLIHWLPHLIRVCLCCVFESLAQPHRGKCMSDIVGNWLTESTYSYLFKDNLANCRLEKKKKNVHAAVLSMLDILSWKSNMRPPNAWTWSAKSGKETEKHTNRKSKSTKIHQNGKLISFGSCFSSHRGELQESLSSIKHYEQLD